MGVTWRGGGREGGGDGEGKGREGKGDGERADGEWGVGGSGWRRPRGMGGRWGAQI